MQLAFICQKVAGVIANICAFRRIRGYSKEYMAGNMNIPQHTYNGMENGIVALTLNDVIQIASILDVDTQLLFILDDPKMTTLRLIK